MAVVLAAPPDEGEIDALVAKLEADLAHLLEDCQVPKIAQTKVAKVGMISTKLFARTAGDLPGARTFIAHLGLDASASIPNAEAAAAMVNAWEASKIRHRELEERDIPATQMVDALLEQVEEGELVAEKLSAALSRAQTSGEVWDNLKFQPDGTLRVARGRAIGTMPTDSEDLRGKYQLIARAWELVLLKVKAPDNSFTYRPSRAILLEFEFQVRKWICSEVNAGTCTLPQALRAAQKDEALLQKHFSDPVSVAAGAAAAVAATAAAAAAASAQRAADRSRSAAARAPAQGVVNQAAQSWSISPPVAQSWSNMGGGRGRHNPGGGPPGPGGPGGGHGGRGRAASRGPPGGWKAGCNNRTADGRLKCFKFNRPSGCPGGCGAVHVCFVCSGAHGMHECPRKPKPLVPGAPPAAAAGGRAPPWRGPPTGGPATAASGVKLEAASAGSHLFADLRPQAELEAPGQPLPPLPRLGCERRRGNGHSPPAAAPLVAPTVPAAAPAAPARRVSLAVEAATPSVTSGTPAGGGPRCGRPSSDGLPQMPIRCHVSKIDWKADASAIYCGRSHARLGLPPSPYANHVGRGLPNAEAAEAFRSWLDRQPDLKATLFEDLADRKLACHCAKHAACRVDVLRDEWRRQQICLYPDLGPPSDSEVRRLAGARRAAVAARKAAVADAAPLIHDHVALQVRSKRGWAQLCDGGGICSQGARMPEDRKKPPKIAEELHRIAARALGEVTKQKGADLASLLSALLDKRGESVFGAELVEPVRASWVAALRALGYPARSDCSRRKQPIDTPLLQAVLRALGDPDADGMGAYIEGAPIGAGVELPRTPEVFAEKTRRALPGQAQAPPGQGPADEEVVRANYPSTEDRVDKIERMLGEAVDQGRAIKMSLADARRKFVSGLTVASLGVQVKEARGSEAGPPSLRLLFDGTHGVQINERIKVRDAIELPKPRGINRVLRAARDSGLPGFLVTVDVKEARELVLVREEDWPLLGCRAKENGWVHLRTVGAFGISSVAYWRQQRTGWKKVHGGFTCNWVGLELQVTKVVSIRELEETFGRMVFVYGALEGTCVRLPVFVSSILRWLLENLERRRSVSVLSMPFRPKASFRVDAKARGDLIVIGGWEPGVDSDGRISAKVARWFSLRVTANDAPWAFDKGLPFKAIAALELLASTVALMVFCTHAVFPLDVHLESGYFADSQVVELSVGRLMSSKYPLYIVLVFYAFEPGRRVQVSFADLDFKVLGPTVAEARGFYNDVSQLRSLRAPAAYERARPVASRKRLRDREPW
ncbi:unnamed protein product [Prorocentrum cordatum]|uniref:DUF4326 domain-containing protein n=1 Tax=Prorocentrum cordatum TaxID=2364126 RepID=A0ABN9PFX2_9DINO|nr:unnamed protein product [Polarella glacialis]